eukprot:m.539758 g.539758  ORF g.539758 m.539758 type:complete len:515 (-) comp22092_c0_seq3:882-2426(-)
MDSCCNLYSELECVVQADAQDLIRSPVKPSIKRGKGGKAASVSDAAATGRLVDVCLAIQSGTKLNSLNRRGIAPLHRLSGSGNATVPIALTRRIVQVLLTAGADIDLPDADGDTPLHIAARAGNSNLVRLLLDIGANAHAENNHQKTALDVAEARDIRQLLAPSDGDKHGGHATDSAADGAGGDNADAGASISPEDMQALRKAVEANETATVERVLARYGTGTRAFIDALDDEGCTCLHLASVHGSTGCAAALLRHGAAVNIGSVQADTPLHYATYADHRDIILLLLRHGARPTLTNSDGVSSLDLASGDVLVELQRATSALVAKSGPPSTAATPTKPSHRRESPPHASAVPDNPSPGTDLHGDSRESRKLRQAIMMFQKMEESEKQASTAAPSARRGRVNSGSSKTEAAEKGGTRRGRPPGYLSVSVSVCLSVSVSVFVEARVTNGLTRGRARALRRCNWHLARECTPCGSARCPASSQQTSPSLRHVSVSPADRKRASGRHKARRAAARARH